MGGTTTTERQRQERGELEGNNNTERESQERSTREIISRKLLVAKKGPWSHSRNT